MACLQSIHHVSQVCRLLRSSRPQSRGIKSLSLKQKPFYKFRDDAALPPEISTINREEASNPDLFHTAIVSRLREDNKRATAAIRKAGWIPSYFRGRNKMPDLLIQVPAAPFARDYKSGLYSHQAKGRVKLAGPLYELRVEEGTTDEYGNVLDVSWIPFERVRVLAQNVQIHILDMVPWGLQFTYCPENEPVRVRVPIRLINEEKSPGMREGGWANRMIRYVDIKVEPFVKPPTQCLLDITGMQMKERRYIGDLQFEGKGEGCSTLLPDDTTTTMITKP